MLEFLPNEQILLILGMTLVTYIPRMAPLLLLASRNLRPAIIRWLEMIPPAVLAALLAPTLFLHSGADGREELFLSRDNAFLIAAVPAFIIAKVTKSFFGTVAVGMAAVALIRHIG